TRTMLRNKIASTFSKEDVNRNASLWKWCDLKKHLPNNCLQKKWIPCKRSFSDQTWTKIVERSKEQLALTFGKNESTETLTTFSSLKHLEREEQLRLHLNGFLLPLALEAKQKVSVEVRHRQDNFPFVRVDYLVGNLIVEAKLNSRMNQDALGSV